MPTYDPKKAPKILGPSSSTRSPSYGVRRGPNGGIVLFIEDESYGDEESVELSVATFLQDLGIPMPGPAGAAPRRKKTYHGR